MGRMLEAFKLHDPHRLPPSEAPAAPRLTWPRPVPPAPPAVSDEEVPFIEVGGSRATMEASPQVLAAGAKLGPKPPAAAAAPRLRAVTPPAGADATARFMSVALRPLEATTSPLGPQQRFAPELVAFHRSEHPVSEQYRALAERFSRELPAGRAQVVLFTALAVQAGTTTVLLNSAITVARQGRLRVAVVEANLRRPALARRLGLCEAPGLRDFLAGTVALTAVLRETGQPNLHALTAGDGGALSAPGDAVRPVLRQLRERFDLVFVDGPCWDGRPEVVALGSACDVAYLVLPEADADTPDAEAWVRTLPQQGARLRGCILTQR